MWLGTIYMYNHGTFFRIASICCFKEVSLNTIDELIIDVLAKSRLPLQKETALQYLCEEGYLARRSYSNIEQLLIKAKEQRNQKGL